MKKLLCLLLIVLMLPLAALAADQPLYTATAKISGSIYAEMNRDSGCSSSPNEHFFLNFQFFWEIWVGGALRKPGFSG